jgi:hypothetical protein
MITTTAPTDQSPSTRTLPRIFSNHPRCEQCRSTYEIRVHYSYWLLRPSAPTLHGDIRGGDHRAPGSPRWSVRHPPPSWDRREPADGYLDAAARC